MGDRFCCENRILSVLKLKEKDHLYGGKEQNRCIQTGPYSVVHHLLESLCNHTGPFMYDTCSWYNKSNERIWCSQKKVPSSRNFESIDPLAYHKMLETTEDSFARGRRIGGEKVK